MPNVILRPNADITNGWSNSGYGNVSDSSDATYAYTYTANKTCSYGLPASGLVSQTISSVTISARGYRNLYDNLTLVLQATTHSTVYSYNHAYLTGNWGTWTTYSDVMAVNPNTGNAWTVAEVDALEIGMYLGWRSASTAYVSDIWVKVEYTNLPTTIMADTNRIKNKVVFNCDSSRLSINNIEFFTPVVVWYL